MSGNSCNGNYARGTQSKGHSMKAKDELASLKRYLAEISMITGTGRSVELAFTDGSRQEFVISKDLHGLPLIKKIIKALQWR